MLYNLLTGPGAAIQNPGIATDSSSSSDMIVTVYSHTDIKLYQSFKTLLLV